MPRQNTPPNEHDPLPFPPDPHTEEEIDLYYALGRTNGGVVARAIRAAASRIQPAPVVIPAPQVTITNPTPVVNNHCGHGHGCTCAHVDHWWEDEGLDVFIAFVLGLVSFFVSWIILHNTTDLSGLNEVRYAGVIGLTIGIIWLAASNLFRWVRR